MVFLSKEAEELLVGAAKSKEGKITKKKAIGGVLAIAAGKFRHTTNSPKETAFYEEAIKTLLEHGFISLSVHPGTTNVTTKGYNQVEEIIKIKGDQFGHLME
jgi:hypothetical protein